MGKAGLVDAQRGLRGGYVLARPLGELTILDVINCVDPLQRIECCPLGVQTHRNTLCALHRRLDEGIARIESLFRGTTIEQLLDDRSPGRNPLCESVLSISAAAGADGEAKAG